MTKHSPSDFGSPYARQHGIYEAEEVDAKKVGKLRLRNTASSPLDYYYKRNILDREQGQNQKLFDAGDRYRGDFHRAGMQPDVIGRYDELVSSGSVAAFFDGQIDMVNAFREATSAIDSIARKDVMNCCLFNHPVGKPRLEILREGLWQLVRHYGY